MPAILRKLMLSMIILFSSVTAVEAKCEKCLSTLNLGRTINSSSVIALVVNRDKNCSASMSSGPAVVHLSILKLYKGTTDGEDFVDVHSWYGDCPFGVHMALNEKAIVMLQEVNDISTGYFDGTYKLVEEGCSEAQLEVRGQRVRVNNAWVDLPSFESQYLTE